MMCMCTYISQYVLILVLDLEFNTPFAVYNGWFLKGVYHTDYGIVGAVLFFLFP